MTVGFYLTNSAAPYTPTTKRGGWEQSGATLARLLGSRPAGAAATASVATGSTAAANDVLWGRWISAGAVAAGTLSGTVRLIVGAVESVATTNAFLALHIYVTSGDSDTPRGTALNNFVGSSEFPTTAAGQDSGTQSLSSVAVSVGDRLVVEIGYRSVSADTTARTATMNYGNTGTSDLGAGSTSVTTQPAWMDFSGADGIWSTPMATLVDTFSTGSTPGAQWTTNGGTPTVSGGVCHLSATTYTSIVSTAGYQLRGSSLVVQFPATPATSGSYAGVRITPLESGGQFAGSYNLPGDSQISFELQPSDPAYTTTTFTSPPTNAWRKFDFTGSSLVYSTSDDGTTWTTRRTASSLPQWMYWSDLVVVFEADVGSGGDELQVDNVNSPPAAVNAPADPATGTGAAGDASSAVEALANAATGTGAAHDANAAAGVSATEATGAGAASSAVIAAAANAAEATGSGAANTAGAALTVAPAEAAGTGSAPDATVSTSGSASPSATEATGAGAASDASVIVTAVALEATAAGAASAPQAAAGVTAAEATGTGSASDAAAAMAVSAGGAAGSGVAADATVTTSAQSNAPATEATGTGSAFDPSTALSVLATAASGTGSSFDATVTTSSQTTATEATGSGSALDAAVALAAAAAVAAGTGTAFDATVSTLAQTDAPAAEAAGAGAAYPATITLTTLAGVAAAAGAAHDASVITGAPGTAYAGAASGTGQAFDARTLKRTPRPYAGITIRPGSGTTTRPYAGITQRP